MSLFIAGQAFAVEFDFAASEIAVFIASILSAAIGTASYGARELRRSHRGTSSTVVP
jgi:Na+/H+ antiporter NhaA